MSGAMQYRYITTSEQLNALSAELLQSRWVAVDTEFFWERTFYPLLGLVQLATSDNQLILIDAPAVGDLRVLGQLLQSPDTVKILHDALQDLHILCAHAEPCFPKNIFDTRRAAGFVGFGASLSLQNLLQQALDISLEKEQTRSNWIARPLSEDQLRYALLDVYYLGRLRERICELAEQAGHGSWLQKEMQCFNDPALYHSKTPEEYWLRVKGASRLSRHQQAQLKQLAAWREQTAQSKDVPRDRIASDRELVEVIKRQPESRRALSGLLRQGPSRRYSADLLQQLQNAAAIPRKDWPQRLQAQKSVDKELVDKVLSIVKDACEARNIDPQLVATRSDAVQFVAMVQQNHAMDHPLVATWRADLLGDQLMEYVQNKVQPD